MITLEDITAALAEAVRTSPHNYVSEQMALAPEDVGQRLYDDPIIAIGSTDDPLWEELKEPQAVGHIFRTPKQWLPQKRWASCPEMCIRRFTESISLPTKPI